VETSFDKRGKVAVSATMVVFISCFTKIAFKWRITRHQINGEIRYIHSRQGPRSRWLLYSCESMTWTSHTCHVAVRYSPTTKLPLSQLLGLLCPLWAIPQ